MLDAPPTCLLDQAEPLHLAAPRARIHQQDRTECLPDLGPGVTGFQRRDVSAERVACRAGCDDLKQDEQDRRESA